MSLAALEHFGMRPGIASAAVQGFGKVGQGVARFLHNAGLKVAAVSDQYGAILNDSGLDIPALEHHVEQTGTVVGFAESEAFLEPSELLLSDVDLLVPAAIEGVIHGSNARGIRARIVVEGANGPTTGAADEILDSNGVLVVPDILANAGGVVVSYFEWVQANQAYWWSIDEVDNRLRDRMGAAWLRVREYADSHELSMRSAATSLAVKTVADAHRARGLYP